MVVPLMQYNQEVQHLIVEEENKKSGQSEQD